MGEWEQLVADRRPIPASIDEWGPDCVRCGDTEYRIDGYCSCECRDVDELERELAQAEAENTTLRERVGALELRSGLYVCDHGCWDVAEVDHTESIPCAYEGHSEMRFYTTDQLARTVFLTDLLTAARHLLDCSQVSEAGREVIARSLEYVAASFDSERRKAGEGLAVAIGKWNEAEKVEVGALRALECAVSRFDKGETDG